MKQARILVAASTLALVTSLTGTAHATGTAAGTVIVNTASATFTSGSTTSTVQSNTVSVKVAELLNVAVTSLNSAPVVAGTGTATLTYQVTNSGNGSEPFNLNANPAVPGNGFNGTIQTVAIDTNGDGVYDAGDTVVTNGAAGPSMAPDTSLKIFVVVNVPGTATDGQTSTVKLNATSVIGSGPAGTVFAGKGAGGVDAVVGATTATAAAPGQITISQATVALTKTASIVDPFGGSTPLPGAVVTYTLVSHTTGSGTANGVTIADNFPAGTTYEPGTMTLAGSALTDASDADAGTVTATGISVALGNVAGGTADKTVTFKVKIN